MQLVARKNSVSYIVAVAAHWTKSFKFTFSMAVHRGGLAKNYFWLVATQKKRIGEYLNHFWNMCPKPSLWAKNKRKFFSDGIGSREDRSQREQHLKLVLSKITDPARKMYMISTFINFSWRLWAQIKHVYLIKFTQTVWLLTNWWIGMNETNLTQHGRSTDVNASDVLYLRDKKKILKKRGILLRRTSF